MQWTFSNTDGNGIIDLARVTSYIENIADLKAHPGYLDKMQVIVAGYYTAGDGGGGVFYYDASASTADNGGTIIAPNAGGTGRWKRQFSGAVNVKWFGATGDGVTDDTAAIQAALNLGTGPVFIPASDNSSNYIVTQLELPSGVKLFGASAGGSLNVGTRLYQKPGSNLSLIVPKSTIPTNEWLHWSSIENMYLHGATGATGGCGIDITRRTGENFLISNVISNNFAESGIRLTRGSTPGRIINCGAFNNGQYGFDLQRTGSDIWHQFTVQSVSGDNNGVALIRVKTYGATYDQLTIQGVKSETSTAGRQQDVVVLDGFNYAPIRIENITAQCSQSMNSIIKIVNSHARVMVRNFRMDSNCAKWIDDVWAGKNYLRTGTTSTSALVDGFWYGNLTTPATYMKQVADYV